MPDQMMMEQGKAERMVEYNGTPISYESAKSNMKPQYRKRGKKKLNPMADAAMMRMNKHAGMMK